MEMITPMAPRKIALLTDSTADLTTQVAEENHIHVVPLRIRCADGEYSDGVDIHAADIYARLRAGELPKTSLPAGEDITAAFDRIRDEGYDGVIAVMLSGGLSGTYNMTRLLAEERRDLEIKVYDSVSGSLGIGVTMLQLAEDLRAGASWRELTHKRVPQLIKNTFAADGQLQSIAKVRGRKQVMDKLIDLVVKACGNHKKYNLAVANGGAPEEMAVLKEKLKAALPYYDHIWDGELDGTLSVYIGDGVLGTCVQVLD